MYITTFAYNRPVISAFSPTTLAFSFSRHHCIIKFNWVESSVHFFIPRGKSMSKVNGKSHAAHDDAARTFCTAKNHCKESELTICAKEASKARITTIVSSECVLVRPLYAMIDHNHKFARNYLHKMRTFIFIIRWRGFFVQFWSQSACVHSLSDGKRACDNRVRWKVGKMAMAFVTF